MKLHILSDLHLEFCPFTPPPADAGVVILAGDIHVSTHGFGWARAMFPEQEIVYVAGNHEFYRYDWDAHLDAMRAEAARHRIYFLEDDAVVMDGVRFLGATLWTDFDFFGEHMRQSAMRACVQYLADFSQIHAAVAVPDMAAAAPGAPGEPGEHRRARVDLAGTLHSTSRLLTPALVRARHLASRAWLEGQLATPFDGKTVVVTHHLPSQQSVALRYRDDLGSAGFASRLEYLMGHSALWIHGHTHDRFDYKIKKTRVICNPRGYCSRDGARMENRAFDPGLVVEV